MLLLEFVRGGFVCNNYSNSIVFDPGLYDQPGGLPASAWYNFFSHNYLRPCEINLLPKVPLNRSDIFEYCLKRDTDDDFTYSELFCYTLIMAWGLQGVTTGWKNARKPMENQNHRQKIVDIGKSLREGQTSRVDSYEKFKHEKISHLNVSYFSKFMFFMSRDRNHYILDIWMAKSINVLLEKCLIPISLSQGGQIKTNKMSGDLYEKYCKTIDKIATAKNITGSQAESALFDARRPWEEEGAWRKLVKKEWEKYAE